MMLSVCCVTGIILICPFIKEKGTNDCHAIVGTDD